LRRQPRASQAEHDQNESDGSRHDVHRAPHGNREIYSWTLSAKL
jgi:hypothetical protein